MKKIAIGQAWVVFERDTPALEWHVMIINKFFNFKNKVRWLAIKHIPKNTKQDIVNSSAFFVFNENGELVTDSSCDDKFYLSHRIMGTKFKGMIKEQL